MQMNDIAEVEFETNLPMFFDAYAENREMGAVILIDAVTNATVGAAMIVEAVDREENVARSGRSGFVWLRGLSEEAEAVCTRLRTLGMAAVVIDDPLIEEASFGAVVRALGLAHVTAVSARSALSAETVVKVKEAAGEAYFESVFEAEEWIDNSRQGDGR